MEMDCLTISSNNDRCAVLGEFAAHIKDILGMLNQLVQDKNLDEFMGILGEEAKNLAARLGKQGAIDKKVERSIKSDLMATFSKNLTDWVEI